MKQHLMFISNIIMVEMVADIEYLRFSCPMVWNNKTKQKHPVSDTSAEKLCWWERSEENDQTGCSWQTMTTQITTLYNCGGQRSRGASQTEQHVQPWEPEEHVELPCSGHGLTSTRRLNTGNMEPGLKHLLCSSRIPLYNTRKGQDVLEKVIRTTNVKRTNL